ncbi:3-oxoacyl-[acyl-carrier-protein] reductase FabG [Alphaproteobacteria bacterium SO-S41]|nr:3-oxoacyl-[acyl-carrier-protein] reductase FabG [Alphaproteobacteria bacterium SO-S41]
MDISLSGRVALITGGSKGLGLATAKAFAAAGADVAIVARDAAGLKAAAEDISAVGQGRVVTAACDVATDAGVTSGYNEVMTALGRIDILVNNAGVSMSGPFETVTDAMWQQDLDLKLFAAIRFARLVWPQMQERRWGRVINVLATAAKTPSARSAPTSVSRAAGMALTKVLAGEGAPHNVLVNALLVGLIESDQWVRMAERSAKPIDEVLQDLGKRAPLGRVGRAEEFASAALFLASEASSYITGTAINVDGGLSPAV